MKIKDMQMNKHILIEMKMLQNKEFVMMRKISKMFINHKF